MLYSQRRHESLQSSPWKEAQAHNVIQAIVTDTEQQWNPQKTYWPIHPLDRDFPPPVPTYTCLYLGAAGVLWALDYLHKATAIDLSLNPAVLIGAVYATYHQAPDTGAVVPSLFMGEVGIALVHWRLAPDDAIANRLYEQIEANIANPTNEAFWAAPGTMLAALWMSEWTGETKWIELYRRNVDYLWQQWQYNSDFDCYLWIQDLYGRTRQMTGPAHGYAGNLYALLRGVDHLATEKQQLLYKRTAQLLAKTAQVKDDAANWLPNVTTRSWLPKQLLAQWCHGAPGMVTSLAQTYPLFHGIGSSLSLRDRPARLVHRLVGEACLESRKCQVGRFG
ncbi:MAG: lanthionine synthetase LanC family protein, partial [Cyanobacteria bacterium J06626_18]